MKSYFLKVKSIGIETVIKVNDIGVASTKSTTVSNFTMPINEFVVEGENILNIKISDKSGEESMRYEVSVCSVVGIPSLDNEMKVLTTVKNYNLPLIIKPFLAHDSKLTELLPKSSVIDVTDSKQVEALYSFFKKVYNAFNDLDLNLISELFSYKFSIYEKAYNLGTGSRKKEFFNSLNSISSTCSLIDYKEELLVPKIHALGHIIEPYYQKFDLSPITYFNESLTHEFRYHVSMMESGEIIIVR